MSAALNDNVIKGVWARTRRSTVEKGGGGGDNTDMEPRIAVLEQIAKDTKATLDRIEKRFDARFDKVDERHERDFRLTMGALIGAVLGLAGLMAKGFHWV